MHHLVNPESHVVRTKLDCVRVRPFHLYTVAIIEKENSLYLKGNDGKTSLKLIPTIYIHN